MKQIFFEYLTRKIFSLSLLVNTEILCVKSDLSLYPLIFFKEDANETQRETRTFEIIQDHEIFDDETPLKKKYIDTVIIDNTHRHIYEVIGEDKQDECTR